MDHVDLFQPFVMHNHTSGEDNGFVNAIVWVNLDNYHLVKVRDTKERGRGVTLNLFSAASL